MRDPLISVIVFMCSCGDALQKSLAGITRQTYKNLEIILVDDSGGEGNLDKVRVPMVGEEHVVRLQTSGHCGSYFARNMGIRAAKGEFLAFVDEGDILLPDFYSLLSARLKQTGAKVVKGCSVLSEEDGTVLPSSVNEVITVGLAHTKNILNLFADELQCAIYNTALVRDSGILNADGYQGDATTFLGALIGNIAPEQFVLENQARVILCRQELLPALRLPVDFCAASVKRLQFKLARLVELPDSEEVARYAAELFEDASTRQLLRAAHASDMPRETLDSFCRALRAELHAYLSCGHVLAKANLATMLIAAGKCADEVVCALERPKPSHPFPKVCKPCPPETPKEKNVAILNLAGGANYGANLTAYALVKAVEREGFHPYLINRRFWYYPALDTDGRFLNFGERHMNWTSSCYGREHYKLLNRYFDTFIVGSDQVWAYQPMWYSRQVPMRDIYDLEFAAPGKRRIAVAPSFGENNFHTAPKDFCEAKAKALARFAAISVRESGGVDICRDYLHAQAQQVLDPVFLLDEQEWKHLAAESTRSLPPEFIATCCLHAPLVPYADSAALCLAHARGWPCLNVMDGTVQDWLQCICRSSLVITDSFHVGCFAIIFRKPVVFLVNSCRGRERIPNLVDNLGISTPLFKEEEIRESPASFLEQVGELPQECTDYSSLRLDPAIRDTADFLHRALHSPMPDGADSIPIDWGKIRAERQEFTAGIRKCMAHTFPRYVYHLMRGIFQRRFRIRAVQEFIRLRRAYTATKL